MVLDFSHNYAYAPILPYQSSWETLETRKHASCRRMCLYVVLSGLRERIAVERCQELNLTHRTYPPAVHSDYMMIVLATRCTST